MNYPAICIEQLDLAAKQLGVEVASYDRFALILTDNIVELMLHLKCESVFRWDQSKWNRKPKYSTEKRKEVLGHHFPPKVKFCKALGVVSPEQADFILNSHEFRNELYHAGIRHDQILHGLAWHYHELACCLFSRLEIGYTGWNSASKVSSTVESYVDHPESAYMSIQRQVPEIAKKLANAKPPFGDSLGQVLSGYLFHRLDELASALDSLVTDNPTHMGESEMIEHVQMYDHIYREDSPWLPWHPGGHGDPASRQQQLASRPPLELRTRGSGAGRWAACAEVLRYFPENEWRGVGRRLRQCAQNP